MEQKCFKADEQYNAHYSYTLSNEVYFWTITINKWQPNRLNISRLIINLQRLPPLKLNSGKSYKRI